jgi:hypothetical protein
MFTDPAPEDATTRVFRRKITPTLKGQASNPVKRDLLQRIMTLASSTKLQRSSRLDAYYPVPLPVSLHSILKSGIPLFVIEILEEK